MVFVVRGGGSRDEEGREEERRGGKRRGEKRRGEERRGEGGRAVTGGEIHLNEREKRGVSISS